MEIKKPAVAGTLESGDVQITVEPGLGRLEIEITSSVLHQFGKQIYKTIFDTLERLGVSDARVAAVDKGALDCTIKARVECAIFRANDVVDNFPWGGAVR